MTFFDAAQIGRWERYDAVVWLMRACNWLVYLLVVLPLLFSTEYTYTYLTILQKHDYAKMTTADAWRLRVYLIVYHVLFALLLINLFKCISRQPHPVSEQWLMSQRTLAATTDEQQHQQIETDLKECRWQPLTRNEDGSYRICKICKIVQPDRCHHCDYCDKCVVRYDHFCYIINRCIGAHNYQQFCLSLVFAFMFFAFIASTSLQFAYEAIEKVVDGEVTYECVVHFVQTTVSLLLCLLLGYQLVVHCVLIAKNRTVFECHNAVFVTSDGDVIDAEGSAFDQGLRWNIRATVYRWPLCRVYRYGHTPRRGKPRRPSFEHFKLNPRFGVGDASPSESEVELTTKAAATAKKTAATADDSSSISLKMFV